MSNQIQKKGSAKDFMVVGFALFAMFFGAGNLIFPPDIGVKTGPQWFIGFLGFFIADGGLAILGMFAMVKAGGKIENVTGLIGAVPAVIINTAVILCIGPGIAIPRTASVTYELGILPITKIDPTNKLALAIFSIVFFAIVFALTIKPSKVIDVIGKFLTPVLVIALLIMIIIGFVAPKGHISTPIEGFESTGTVVQYGILNGYQTMDGMASIFFAIIVISSIYAKGYTSKKESTNMTIKASVVAGFLLFIVYGGLSFLGATTGTLWKEGVAKAAVSQPDLVINITNAILGTPGVIILGIVVALACLTTAIGLTSATGEYFEELTKGKLKYSVVVTIVCIVSALLCNLGLAQILKIAVPILLLVYPIIVLLIITSLFRKQIGKKIPYMCGALAAFIVSAITVLNGYFGIESLSWITKLPLNSYGFNWLVPTAIAMIIGMFLPGKKFDTEEE